MTPATVDLEPIRPLPTGLPTGPELDVLLARALAEDVGSGDVTTDATLPAGKRGRARLVSKAHGVLAGLAVFERVFALVDPDVEVRVHRDDGATVAPGDLVAELEGELRGLLIAERTALNFLQRLSGIASLTRRYVDAAGPGARVLDTRKTTPGLRALEKYAVYCGGGENHRMGLHDAAMIKENHVEASGLALRELVERVRARDGSLTVTVEARDEGEALLAVDSGADVVLLDNFTPAALSELVPRLRAAAAARSRPLQLEASGGVDLESIGAFARSGVDRVSVGALTHSAPALDVSLLLEAAE